MYTYEAVILYSGEIVSILATKSEAAWLNINYNLG